MTPTHFHDKSGWPALLKAASIYGVSSAIALSLVYWLTQVQQGQLTRVENTMHDITVQVVDHARETSAITVRLEALMQQLVRINQQNCVNAARTSEERRGCFQ